MSYDTATVQGVLRVQKVVAPFYLNFFKSAINFDTDYVDFDKVYQDDRKLAPFVVPNVQGQIMSFTGYEARRFKPAYVKPKHAVDPNMVLPRQAGEAYGTGSLSLGQRRNAVIAELTRQHKVLHMNRREWLAAKALIDGGVTIAGENYPSTYVDFRRDASLTTVLSGAAKWDQTTGVPLTDIQNSKLSSNALSNARPTTLIFGQNAWTAFCARVDLRSQMSNQFVNQGGYGTAVNMIPEGYVGVEYIGRISGSNGSGGFEIYVDTSKYIDPTTGALAFFLDQGTVLGIDPDAVQGFQCFGAIKDFDANFAALDIYIKMWMNQDPSVEYILSQSAPLMVPKEPNATFSIKAV